MAAPGSNRRERERSPTDAWAEPRPVMFGPTPIQGSGRDLGPIGPKGIARSQIWPQCASMEYKGIRYTIRVGIVRHEWSVGIHPAGFEPVERSVTGNRRLAELRAYSLIDIWLSQHRAREA